MLGNLTCSYYGGGSANGIHPPYLAPGALPPNLPQRHDRARARLLSLRHLLGKNPQGVPCVPCGAVLHWARRHVASCSAVCCVGQRRVAPCGAVLRWACCVLPCCHEDSIYPGPLADSSGVQTRARTPHLRAPLSPEPPRPHPPTAPSPLCRGSAR